MAAGNVGQLRINNVTAWTDGWNQKTTDSESHFSVDCLSSAAVSYAREENWVQFNWKKEGVIKTRVYQCLPAQHPQPPTSCLLGLSFLRCIQLRVSAQYYTKACHRPTCPSCTCSHTYYPQVFLHCSKHLCFSDLGETKRDTVLPRGSAGLLHSDTDSWIQCHKDMTASGGDCKVGGSNLGDSNQRFRPHQSCDICHLNHPSWSCCCLLWASACLDPEPFTRTPSSRLLLHSWVQIVHDVSRKHVRHDVFFNLSSKTLLCTSKLNSGVESNKSVWLKKKKRSKTNMVNRWPVDLITWSHDHKLDSWRKSQRL